MSTSASTTGAPSHRWVILALLFFATTINYIDRQILALLKPMLDAELGWTNEQYGYVNSAFQAAYAFGLVGFGWFIDRFGVKIGYAVSIFAWSAAAAAHALVADEDVFDREHRCMAHVECSCHIRRRQHDGVGLCIGSGDAFIDTYIGIGVARRLPELADARLIIN